MTAGTRRIFGLAIAVCALALPAVAQADVRWEQAPDPAPGSVFDDYRVPPWVSLGVANRTPYVASVAGGRRGGQITVWRPNRSGTGWRQLGGVLNHDPARNASDPHLSAGGSTPWITWTELDAQGVAQVRLAGLAGGSFREPVPRDTITAPEEGHTFDSRVIVYDGRPYVTYTDSTTHIHVVRPRRNWRWYEAVDAGLERSGASGATPLISGGRLFIVYTEATAGTEETRVARLNRAGNRWEDIPAGSRLGSYIVFYSQVAWARGVAYRSYGEDSYNGPGANLLLRVEAFLDGAWQRIAAPGIPGYDVRRSQLVGADGTLWILWDEAQADMSPERLVHLAKLVGSP